MGNAFFLVVAGLLLFYVVISDKFYCIEGCIACLGGEYVSADKGLPVVGGAVQTPGISIWGGPIGGGGGGVSGGVGGILGVGGHAQGGY